MREHCKRSLFVVFDELVSSIQTSLAIHPFVTMFQFVALPLVAYSLLHSEMHIFFIG